MCRHMRHVTNDSRCFFLPFTSCKMWVVLFIFEYFTPLLKLFVTQSKILVQKNLEKT